LKVTLFRIRPAAVSLFFLSVFTLFSSVCGISSSHTEEFKVKVDVKLKLFDVLVFDSDEKPVKNLHKDQFKVFINGLEVEIGTFDVIDYTAQEELRPNPNKITLLDSGSRISGNDIVGDRRLFVIIFHNLPWAQDARQEIAEGIYKFIEDNHSVDDFYALYFFSGPSIKLLHPFTNNPQSIKEVIDELYINNSAGFKPFLPGSGDWIKSVQSEFGSEGMIRSVTTGPTVMGPKFSDAMSSDYMDSKTIYEMNVTLRNLDVLLRSFSSFKGRKEVFLFSDSISLKRYNPTRGFLGRGKTGIEYDRLIQDARTNNITINSFKVVRRDPFVRSAGVKTSEGGSPAEVDQQEGMTKTGGPSGSKSLSRKLSNDLKVVAEETGGLYFDKASRKKAIAEGLEEAYYRSSYVYYLGIYLNNMELDKSKAHSVRIEVADENAEIIYQTSFRLDPEYKKMDDSDRFSQFLDALFGVKKYDTLQVADSLLHFPYGQNGNLLISVFRLPLSVGMGEVFNFAVKYYNTAEMLDKQLLRTWNIGKNKDKSDAGSARFVVGIPLDAGEYIYRYVARDEENGSLKNAEYIIHIDSGKGILSSPVVFGATDLAASFTNLLDFNDSKDQENETEPDFILNEELNPLIYNGKLFAPLIEEPIIRTQETYLMFMYNSFHLKKNNYQVHYYLMGSAMKQISFPIETAEAEKEFPGGWRRITLKLLLAEIPLDIKDLKFFVAVKDQTGKEIESEYLDILLK